MTTTSPYVAPNALRLRLRSSSEERDDSGTFTGLNTDLISEPSQTPSSIEVSIGQSSDEPTTEESSRAEQTYINKLRQARDFLQSPNNLSRDSLAKRHKEIRGLLQTLREESGDPTEPDLELYEDVKTWFHLRTKPDVSGFLAVGGKRRGVAVRPTEHAAILPEGPNLPAEKTRSRYIANGHRSAANKARDTTLLGVKPKFLTTEEAMNGMGRRFEDSNAEGQEITGQYPDFKNTDAASEDTPTPQELPDFASPTNPHRPKDPTSAISNSSKQPFLMGETTHLQTLMSAQIERDLIHGNSLLLPRHTVPPTN